jgi:hypothetical protein
MVGKYGRSISHGVGTSHGNSEICPYFIILAEDYNKY